MPCSPMSDDYDDDDDEDEEKTKTRRRNEHPPTRKCGERPAEQFHDLRRSASKARANNYSTLEGRAVTVCRERHECLSNETMWPRLCS